MCPPHDVLGASDDSLVISRCAHYDVNVAQLRGLGAMPYAVQICAAASWPDAYNFMRPIILVPLRVVRELLSQAFG